MSEAPFAYSVYGLDIRSDLALPGLLPADGTGIPLRIETAGGAACPLPPGSPAWTGGFERLWHLADDHWFLHYCGDDANVPSWTIDAQAGRLGICWSERSQLNDIPTLLLGPGLALSLHLQGAFLLHASAIMIDGRAILIIGPSGAGKSTTAAALVRAGCPLISDDVAALDMDGDMVRVHRGPGRLRVYPQAARAAGWPSDLPRLFHHPMFDDKRYIEPGGADCGDSVPVVAIYLLAGRAPGRSETTIARLSPRQALGTLLANIYCVRFLPASRARAASAACAALAGRLSVRAVHAADDLDALGTLVDDIVRDASGLP